MDKDLKNDSFCEQDIDISSFGLIAAISKTEDCTDEDFDNVIQIIDESGDEVNITQERFVELFDKEGLSGLIL